MIQFTTSIDIEASVEAVFDYVSTGENFDEWNSAVKKIKILTDEPKGLGSKYIMMRELPQGRVFNELEVIEFEPNEEFIIKTTSGETPFKYDYIFAPKNEGTRLILEAEVKLSGFKDVISPILARFIKRGVNKNFQTLKKILEKN
jgi:hypothetical protein